MELEIIDALLPDLEEEVIDVNLVQRMHKSGRKVNFRVVAVVTRTDTLDLARVRQERSDLQSERQLTMQNSI